jgi:hypothetical protein
MSFVVHSKKEENGHFKKIIYIDKIFLIFAKFRDV